MTLENIPDGLIIEEDGVQGKVSIVVEDVESILDKLTEKDFNVIVDMQNIKEGINKKPTLVIDSMVELKKMSIVENRVVITVKDKNKQN